MSSLDGYELPDLAARSPIENYARLVGLIETAYTSGVLAPLPAVEGEEVEEPLVGARVSTLRTWLHLLGYLRSDSGEAIIDSGLRRAIQGFQKEAGLKDDGWVDRETWTALEELVSFEVPANVPRWMSGSEPSRPLLRAVGLRLTAFGLLDRPTRNQRQVRQGLHDFVRVANTLRLAETRLEAGYSQATLTVLFDQDGLVQRLAHFEGAFNFSPPADRPEEATWALVEHFVACCARIELWLLGYKIDLAGSASLAGKEWRFVVPPLEGQPGAWRKAEYAAYYVLYRFWRDSGQASEQAWRLAREGITGAFFRRVLANLEDETRPGMDEDQSQALYAEIVEGLKKHPEDRAKVWQFIQEIGSRMWDGLRRAWHWLCQMFSKTSDHVLAWFRNLARLTYQYALATLEHVRLAVKRLLDAGRYLIEPVVPGSQPAGYIFHDRDLDYYVCAGDLAAAMQVRRLAQEMQQQAAYFGAGCRLLVALLRAVVAAVQGLAMPGAGWFAFILALVKVYREARLLVVEGT